MCRVACVGWHLNTSDEVPVATRSLLLHAAAPLLHLLPSLRSSCHSLKRHPTGQVKSEAEKLTPKLAAEVNHAQGLPVAAGIGAS